MEIEIKEFYASEYREDKGIITGTLRIKLPIGIHILGVFASRRNGRWFFGLPCRKSVHHESGEKVRYPIIVFEDRDTQKELMDAIHKKAPIFIENRIVSGELVFSGKSSFNKRKSSPTDDKPKPGSLIPNRVWVDPPPRKIATAHHQRNLGRR